ncbi:MAG: Gfo/Idh/MocA family oxidoreductase [Ignavibacteriales bacterium]|nr:Gfo/Idh/MocA family oxidoreductase [Ignavibacteriales bacterium]
MADSTIDKPKIGIVGLGWIAQVFHLPILSKLQDVEIACVCDRDKNKARALADKYGIPRYYTSFEEMLKHEDLHAVDVCTSTDAHTEVSIACMETKRDVFVEKPIARTYAEALRIADSVKKNKRKLMVGMNHRFRPDTMMLRSFIENNEFGKIFYAKAGWLKKPSTESSWLMQGKLSGGGVFIDLGIVMLDLALWMTGYPEVSRVSATDYTHKTKVEDSSVAFITMKNGATITIEVSWNFHIENELYYCNIYGEQGSGKINPLMIHKEMHGNVVNVTPVKTDASQNAIKKSYENELKHFVGALRGIHPVISTAQEAVQRMKIVDAVYKSADKGKEIYFK